MFECDREKFLKLKNISTAPSLSALQEFYSKNFWRVDPFEDPGAWNCYERLYYFWQNYKEIEFPWLAVLGIGLFVFLSGIAIGDKK
jgi:hypothetical protein